MIKYSQLSWSVFIVICHSKIPVMDCLVVPVVVVVVVKNTI